MLTLEVLTPRIEAYALENSLTNSYEKTQLKLQHMKGKGSAAQYLHCTNGIAVIIKVCESKRNVEGKEILKSIG